MKTTLTKPHATTVKALTAIYRQEAACVLHRAFTGYPLMEYMFEESTPQQWAAFKMMFEALIESRLVRKWPVLGAPSRDRQPAQRESVMRGARS